MSTLAPPGPPAPDAKSTSDLAPSGPPAPDVKSLSILAPQDAADLASVLKALEPRLQALLWRYDVPQLDAEDVIQDAVLAMLSRWSQIDDKLAWLFVTARNRCVSYQRHRLCRTRLVDAMDPERLKLVAPVVESPQLAAETAVDIGRVLRVLSELAEKDRRLLRLRYVHGLGPSAIASRIGCHPGSVRKAIFRALSRLREALGRS